MFSDNLTVPYIGDHHGPNYKFLIGFTWISQQCRPNWGGWGSPCVLHGCVNGFKQQVLFTVKAEIITSVWADMFNVTISMYDEDLNLEVMYFFSQTVKWVFVDPFVGFEWSVGNWWAFSSRSLVRKCKVFSCQWKRASAIRIQREESDYTLGTLRQCT